MTRYWTYRGLSLLQGRYAKHRFAPHVHDACAIAVNLNRALAFRCAGDWDQHVKLVPELQAPLPEAPVVQDAPGARLLRYAYGAVAGGAQAIENDVAPAHRCEAFFSAHAEACAPHKYQHQVRVSFGLQRLRQGAPSTEAANDAGYADHNHCTRALKRTYAVTASLVERAA